MKRLRIIESVTSQNVCIFCSNRLQSQHNTAPSPFRSCQKRVISGTPVSQKPPAEAVAHRDDEFSQTKVESPPQTKKWGKFAVPVKASSLDPEPQQGSPKWGTFARQTSATNDSTSLPDQDVPLQEVYPSAASDQAPRRPRPSPRWDESESTANQGFASQGAASHERGENNSSRPLIRWRSVGKSNDERDGGFGADTQRLGSQIRTDAPYLRTGDGKPASNQGWGRHLRTRRDQNDQLGSADNSSGPVVRMIDSKEKPEITTRASEDTRPVRRLNRDQKGFLSFRSVDLSKPPTSEPYAASERQQQQAMQSPSSTGTKFNNYQAPEWSNSSRPTSRSTPSISEIGKSPQASGADDPVSVESPPIAKELLAQEVPKHFPEMMSAPKVLSLEERREARSRRDKKGKKTSKFDDEEDSYYADEAPKRQTAAGTPKKKQQRHDYEDEDEGHGYRDEIEDELDFDEEFGERTRRQRKKQRQQEKLAKQAAAVQTIDLPPFISVGQLATALHVRLEPFIEKMEELGFEEIANEHVLSFENSSLIAMEYGYEVRVDNEDEDLKARPVAEDQSLLPPRPPIVTIMGHVDHGKTTLLDFLRESSVAASEHGGITQHIGAFSVPMASGKVVTFLDTPGHAAFLSMRQRGANVTDIVVLVVAADDSVKPQTIEAIKHARSAKVPIIVAINKVDKDEADVQRVKQDLMRHEIEVEDFGGDVQAIPVSGKTGQGMDELEEALVALAETLDMRAELDGPTEGWVLEATTTKAGRVATVLVRRGTLRPGDVIVAGTTWTRVRTLKNEAGAQVAEAPPGTPVEVDGWRDQPVAGDEVLQAPTEQKATSVVDFRIAKLDREQDAKDMEAINEARQATAEKREREKAERDAADSSTSPSTSNTTNGPPRGSHIYADSTSSTSSDPSDTATTTNTELYILIKADVSGSAEAISTSLLSLPLHNHPISLSLLRSGVGPLTPSDIDHISAVPRGRGLLISFNQPVPQSIAHAAEMAGVKLLDENIIYKVIDGVRGVVEDSLPPLLSRRVTGEAEAAQIFEINVGGRKFVKVMGVRVRNGIVGKGKRVRVFRGGMDDRNVVYDGTINSLKSQKKDVAEMRKGSECGMGFEGWEGFLAGDVVQCYEEKSEKRRLT